METNKEQKKKIEEINGKFGREMMGGVFFVSVVMFFSNFYFDDPLLWYFSVGGFVLTGLTEFACYHEIEKVRKHPTSD
jgi:hypothetical protein